MTASWLVCGLGAASLSACALIAGIGDHDVAPAEGRGGDTGSASASSSGGGGLSSSGMGPGSSSSSGGGKRPFPATPILDDFDRLDGHVGLPWLEAIPSQWEVSLDHLVSTVRTPDAIAWSEAFGGAQEAYVTLEAGFSNAEVELFFRADGANECPSVYLTTYLTGYLTVGNCTTDGGFANIEEIQVTLRVGDQLGGRIGADGLFEVYVNGDRLATIDASAAENMTGRIGIYASGLGDRLVLDDFGGGDVP